MLPVDTFPPKSGCMRRVDPMNEMYAAEAGSTGAADTSRFHQLLGGNSGGSGPPLVLAARIHVPAVAIARRVRTSVERRV